MVQMGNRSRLTAYRLPFTVHRLPFDRFDELTNYLIIQSTGWCCLRVIPLESYRIGVKT